MDTSLLRQATAAEHAATEDRVPLMSPGLTRDSYVDVLRGFYRVVRAWDAWAAAHVPDDLRDVLKERRTAHLLEEDLCFFSADLPREEEIPYAAMSAAPSGNPRAVFLGRMYVMEGSTLGGQMLARHVEDVLQLAPGEGDRYFLGYGELTSARWREFKGLLESLPDHETETVIAAAKNMFAIFSETMPYLAGNLPSPSNRT